jgi:hypothetical protein
MKDNKTLLFLFLFVIGVILISGTLNNSGSPGGKTGSPYDVATCAQCHSSSVTSVDWISSNIPESGYISGQTYLVTINAVDAAASKIGFEITSENSLGKQGTFVITDNERTKLTNNNNATTHRSAGLAPEGGVISWNVEWIAPAKETGDVVFYASFNAANGNGSTSGDKIYTSKLTVKENVSTDINHYKNSSISIYPNPAIGYFNVESSLNMKSIAIFDLSGKLVENIEDLGSMKRLIRFDGYKPGLYIVKIKTFEGETVKKIQVF